MLDGYECPPDEPGDDVKYQDNCQLKRGGGCRKANPWVEWLVLQGGQGKSRREITAGYHARPARYNSAYFCKAAKARGTSHELEIEKIGNPVEYYTSQPSITPLKLYNSRRRKIAKDLRRVGFTNNFDPDSITADDIEEVVRTIDRYYFNGTLIEDMNEYMNLPLTFNVIDDAKEIGAMAAKMYDDIHDNLNTIEMVFNAAQWERKKVRVDGIKTQHKLDELILACEHELTHAIEEVYKPQGVGDSEGHGLVFRVLLNRLFGHSENIHTYIDFDDEHVE
jgi:hypothetical protein